MASPGRGVSVSLGSLRLAVITLRLGLVDHRVVEPERWDRAVATVARSQYQLDGETRRCVYAVFRAARWDAEGVLETAIIELEAHLASAHGGQDDNQQLSLFDAP